LVSTQYDCWLDIDKQKAKSYLEKIKSQEKQQKELIKRLESRLANKDYLKKAPIDIVNQTKDQLNQEQELLDKLNGEIASFTKSLKS
jgi:valyl-tRNA synthetase